jgi:succinyl-CoA synthetase beta subunit
MKIHEYQAKELFKKYGIPVPDGSMAVNPDEARGIAEGLDSFPVVIKAQIHAGGRGKAGGVKLANSIDEVSKIADDIIWMNMVTPQTGPEGKLVKKILVERALNIKKEIYLSITPDRETSKILVLLSQEGGMDIEEVSSKTPEKIIKIYINPLMGMQQYHCREAAFELDLPPDAIKQFVGILKALYKMFLDYDCSLIEINPLVITADDSIIAADAKIVFDTNALFKHKDIQIYRDVDEEVPLEVEASKYNLNYIKMDGNIGNMVNGAGLAMATMDIIKLAGAEPANFLDVGGGASSEMVENGFRIMLSDKNVKGILINIFGGILRCDVLAGGVVHAAMRTGIKVPVVVRMEGTNVEAGRKILNESGLNLTSATDLKDAAQKVAQIVGSGQEC